MIFSFMHKPTKLLASSDAPQPRKTFTPASGQVGKGQLTLGSHIAAKKKKKEKKSTSLTGSLWRKGD